MNCSAPPTATVILLFSGLPSAGAPATADPVVAAVVADGGAVATELAAALVACAVGATPEAALVVGARVAAAVAAGKGVFVALPGPHAVRIAAAAAPAAP